MIVYASEYVCFYTEFVQDNIAKVENTASYILRFLQRFTYRVNCLYTHYIKHKTLHKRIHNTITYKNNLTRL